MTPDDILKAARWARQAQQVRQLYDAAIPIEIRPHVVGGIRADLIDTDMTLDAAATTAVLNALDLHLADRMKSMGIDVE